MTRRIAAAASLIATLTWAAWAAGAAVAAEAPQWRVVADTNPTNYVPESPRDQVEELVVNAGGGTFTLTWYSEGAGKEVTTAAVPHDATAAELATAIYAADGNYEGKVSVVGEGAGESAPYRITYSGEEVADKPMPQMTADGGALTGAGASAAVKLIAKGEFVPELRVVAVNVGGASTDGSQITVSDLLPAGVKATAVTGHDAYGFGGFAFGPGAMSCEAAPTISCTYNEPVMPGDQLVVRVKLEVEHGASGTGISHMSVVGGGASEVKSESPITVSNSQAGYGVEPGSALAAVSTPQAGAHPNVTTAFALNLSEKGLTKENANNVRFDLPPGLVGQATNMPRCTMAAVEQEAQNGKACPSDTMVGMATITYVSSGASARVLPGSEGVTETLPVYNIAPAPGEPVAFGFLTLLLPVRLDTSVLSNGEYGVRVTAHGLTEAGAIMSSTITIWGVPADMNGPGPGLSLYGLATKGWRFGGSGAEQGESRIPLLTNPQQCGKPLAATMETDSWQSPGTFHPSGVLPMGTLSGCEDLRFEPTFSMVPDTLRAGAPAGYDFTLKVPQRNEVETLATPTVKNVKLTLPAGTVINPAAAQGLQACSNAQFYGGAHPTEEAAAPAKCPSSAKVGSVSIRTPALEETLEGEVYLAQPECDPCTSEDAADGRMVRLFLNVVGRGEAGIVVKLEGHGQVNQQTGQITTIFENDPQLPFSELKLKLTGGERAVVANPRRCGEDSSTLDVASWDEALPESGLTAPVAINEGCFGPKFTPSFTAGMPNIQAGAHGQFTLGFGREDQSQFLKQITLKMPPGLLGTLTGVELCKQAQANAGSCGPNSAIGETQVLTGPGADPFLVEGGKVYLTEGYGGSQFGLSIVVPAVAGPYTLGGLNGEGAEVDDGKVVVRAQLYIDRHTAQITAVSGTLPNMLDGIPLQLKAVNVKLNRPGFMFNPTSCEAMAITGTMASWEGMAANVASPFQVTNCARLPFEPTVTASTSAQTSRKDGASLHVSIGYPKGSQGTEANLAYAKVELPKALPSELKTLNHACLAKVFAANPAGCPAESVVGHAVVRTPVLPVPLEGPAYFVSEGAEWPELIMVLQGYGVTVELVGETKIEHGVTSSTFKGTPDVPFETFELTLPEQGYSALAANGNLCQQKLTMPTYLHGQNGAGIARQTPIEVQGCANRISVVSKRLKGDTLILKVAVPGAGKLTAQGRAVGSASRSAQGRETLTLKLPVKRRALARRGRHAQRGGKGKHAKAHTVKGTRARVGRHGHQGAKPGRRGHGRRGHGKRAHGRHGHGRRNAGRAQTTIRLLFKPASGKRLVKKIKARI
ncbi:MAG: hypothetical protein ACYCUM_04455 [Solirubrobacteraceae bacterium]